MFWRILSLLSIPLMGLTIWGLIRQVRKEQPLRLSTPIFGLAMAPLALLVNVLLLRQTFSVYLGPAVLVLGLGFGLAWGQTTRLYASEGALVAKRSVLHLLFWGVSYAITQLLSTFTKTVWVAGGLATMFFSTGSSLGTNLNLLVRQVRARSRLRTGLTPATAQAAPSPTSQRPGQPRPRPPSLPERPATGGAVPPTAPERRR